MIATWCGIGSCSESFLRMRPLIGATTPRRTDRTLTAHDSLGIEFRCASAKGRRYSRALKRDAIALLTAAGLPDCELSLTLTTDASIRALNREYRKKDRPT